jgi:hypothetical protein
VLTFGAENLDQGSQETLSVRKKVCAQIGTQQQPGSNGIFTNLCDLLFVAQCASVPSATQV